MNHATQDDERDHGKDGKDDRKGRRKGRCGTYIPPYTVSGTYIPPYTVSVPVSRMSWEEDPTNTANAPVVTAHFFPSTSQLDTSRSVSVYDTDCVDCVGVSDDALKHTFWK